MPNALNCHNSHRYKVSFSWPKHSSRLFEVEHFKLSAKRFRDRNFSIRHLRFWFFQKTYCSIGEGVTGIFCEFSITVCDRRLQAYPLVIFFTLPVIVFLQNTIETNTADRYSESTYMVCKPSISYIYYHRPFLLIMLRTSDSANQHNYLYIYIYSW